MRPSPPGLVSLPTTSVESFPMTFRKAWAYREARSSFSSFGYSPRTPEKLSTRAISGIRGRRYLNFLLHFAAQVQDLDHPQRRDFFPQRPHLIPEILDELIIMVDIVGVLVNDARQVLHSHYLAVKVLNPEVHVVLKLPEALPCHCNAS